MIFRSKARERTCSVSSIQEGERSSSSFWTIDLGDVSIVWKDGMCFGEMQVVGGMVCMGGMKNISTRNFTEWVLPHSASGLVSFHACTPWLKLLHLKRFNMPPHAFGDSAFAVAAF